MESRTHHSTPVADDWNWTARVRNEINSNKQAALAAGGAGAGGNPPGPSGRDSLATFMQQTNAGTNGGPSSPTALSYIASKQRDSARLRKLEQQDSLDGFVSSYAGHGNPKARPLPAQEFRKPITTSQEYGWGRSLEKFGPLQLMLN
ncbi:hypothetical protein GPECTOR_4g999 [Gonium pectorale]|uniref:Uncharacterized protein n=1 Tax=Gonium pectorale TaxID=33097 RepID=A0A150GYD5_GONPE|nr:hypothetical protein GPECTOR_4g999 [Gonium pectorale]|eukprot:KXZ54926.1 hypothetical protein GPECTOR_4g999 [Gonium pectorale]